MGAVGDKRISWVEHPDGSAETRDGAKEELNFAAHAGRRQKFDQTGLRVAARQKRVKRRNAGGDEIALRMLAGAEQMHRERTADRPGGICKDAERMDCGLRPNLLEMLNGIEHGGLRVEDDGSDGTSPMSLV